MRSLATATAATFLLLTMFAAAPASAEAPTGGGCQEFGNFVALLATERGSDFGGTASGVASSAPRAFPTGVVFPEQESFCS